MAGRVAGMGFILLSADPFRQTGPTLPDPLGFMNRNPCYAFPGANAATTPRMAAWNISGVRRRVEVL